jgi:hypothetical protein
VAPAVFAGVQAQQANRIRSVVRWTEGLDSDPGEAAAGRLVSANYVDVVGVSAHRGRTFLPEDETAPGANPVVVLSHGYWQRRFGANPEVIGGRLEINGRAYTVRRCDRAPLHRARGSGDDTAFWVPLTMQAEFTHDDRCFERRDAWWLLVFGRLQTGVPLQTAEASANLTLQGFSRPIHGSPPIRRRGRRCASDCNRHQRRLALSPGFS